MVQPVASEARRSRISGVWPIEPPDPLAVRAVVEFGHMRHLLAWTRGVGHMVAFRRLASGDKMVENVPPKPSGKP